MIFFLKLFPPVAPVRAWGGVFRSCGLPSNKTSLKKDRARHRLRRRPRTWRTGERTSLFIASATPDASCWRSRDLVGDKCEGPSFRDPARDLIAPLANDGRKPSAEQPLCRSPNLPKAIRVERQRAVGPQPPPQPNTRRTPQAQAPTANGHRPPAPTATLPGVRGLEPVPSGMPTRWRDRSTTVPPQQLAPPTRICSLGGPSPLSRTRSSCNAPPPGGPSVRRSTPPPPPGGSWRPPAPRNLPGVATGASS